MKKHRTKYEEGKKGLIAAARKVAIRAVSYRGFDVGCIVLAFNPVTGKYKIFPGVNIKPKEDGPKLCAEQTAVVSAIAHGYNVIVAIVVAGMPQPDSRSGKKTETLHPCYICRDILSELPGVSHDTMILTVHNGFGIVEEQTFGDLLKFHNHCEC